MHESVRLGALRFSMFPDLTVSTTHPLSGPEHVFQRFECGHRVS